MFCCYFIPAPEGLTSDAWKVAAIVSINGYMVGNRSYSSSCYSLVAISFISLFQITSFKSAALPYANPNIYLFLGGFMLAIAIERSGLHKRMALKMILAAGSSGMKLIGGFMLVAALISMFVMNTSTTLMLLPIGLAVCSVIAKTIPN